MFYKLHYSSIKNKYNIFDAFVKYEGEKYNYTFPILRIYHINKCTEEYLVNAEIGDYFICTDINEQNLMEDSSMKLKLFEWHSEKEGKHYHFDIYHNYDNNIPNTTLVRIN